MSKRILIIVIVVGMVCGLIVLLSPHIRLRPENNSSSVSNANTVAAECLRDSDCLISGCSGTLCVPRDQTPPQYTTCEWRPEYACFAEDDCLCRAGQCRWAGTEAYDSCVSQLK